MPLLLRRAAGPVILLAAIAALLAVQVRGSHHAALARPVPAPSYASRLARGVDLGVTTEALARNVVAPWRAGALRSVNAFEQQAHQHASVLMWYADWVHDLAPSLRQLALVHARGSIPEITWEPWDAFQGLYHAQPAFALARIVAGDYDPLVRRWAQALAAYGHEVRLRFGQEMNGNWYPWSEEANGNAPGQFVAAWRHVHDIFTQAGAGNVRWVWSPVAVTVKAEEYPGDAYVDMVGLSGFNGGPQVRFHPWRSFDELFGPSLAALHQIAPSKPVEISEVATSEHGGDKAAWLADLLRSVPAHPEIVSLVYFDLAKGGDWPIDTSRRAERAFASLASRPPYR